MNGVLQDDINFNPFTKSMKQVYPGDLIMLTGIMPKDPAPLPIGQLGVIQDVKCVGDFVQYEVIWESNSGLFLLSDDPFMNINFAINSLTPYKKLVALRLLEKYKERSSPNENPQTNTELIY